MNTDRKKAFLRSLKKISDTALKAKVEKVYQTVKTAKTMHDIPNLQKVEGCPKGISYRIRIGRYRIGVEIERDLVTFLKFGPRNIFYKTFP
ncbi:MAG: hypothetical protein FWH18_03435 [Marinilabiliaceae bacterium]|nr:hypothetical protein [Marinilabiliaceae bacterium]